MGSESEKEGMDSIQIFETMFRSFWRQLLYPEPKIHDIAGIGLNASKAVFKRWCYTDNVFSSVSGSKSS